MGGIAILPTRSRPGRAAGGSSQQSFEEGWQGVMARKTVNRKELRAQSDAAEARAKSTKKVAKEKPVKEKKVKAVKEKKVAAKKPSRKKVAKEVRMKAYWGVFNPSMKRLVLFEYADKKAAEKKASDLTASSRSQHFVQLVKEAISE
ncbi:MAG: hypothetical protein WCJ31_21570 [Planctomycetia bacterium]